MTTHSSKACCETPAAVSEGYESKGSYQTIANTQCYVAGPRDATKAIFFLYDVFGFAEQTLQGADILAFGGKDGYIVIMPDLLDGKPAQPEWFARDTEEKKQKITDFVAGIREPQPYLQLINKIFGAAKNDFPAIQNWGCIGFCWGGKLVALSSNVDTNWSVGVMSSPARVDPEDAKQITIPFATLGSKGESADDMKAFHHALTIPNKLHIFESQIHGWMSARADLKDSEVRKAYELGYRYALDFFAEHL